MRSAYACLALTPVLLIAADAVRLSFETGKVGQLPKGWTATKTGSGAGSVWKLVEDKSAPGGPLALAQTSAEGSGSHFNLCVKEDVSYKDLDLSVSFKAIAGRSDQGGGLVWRYQDANNYYIARMNPLEDNFRVYKVVGGRRMQLGDSNVKIATGEWHTMKIEMEGDHFEGYIDGKQYLDVKDSTFQKPGKIGLWTKADAQTRFADLQIASK